MKRRTALTTFGMSSIGLGLIAGLGRQALAQDADEEKTEMADDGMVDLLFVQEAEGVTFENGQLTMKGLNPNTLFFSDRPDDVAGFLTYAEFIDMVATGPDNFIENPPNATLIVFDDGNLSEAVLELSEKPVLEGGDLTFSSVKLIQGQPPASGKTAVLFIDTFGHPLSPGSVAGVHRRHRRRRRRRIIR